MQFLLCLLFATVASVNMQHGQLNRAVADLAPKEVKKSIDDFKYLVGLGEDSRAMALKNESIRQKIYDDAVDAHDKAFQEEQTALGNQRDAEEKEQEAIKARDAAIVFKNKRIKEKEHADSWIAPTKEHMEKEQARVAEERVALEKVKDILEKLLANGGKAKVEIEANGRKLLSTSRTVTLLTAPSFIASLQNADPSKVQSVLDIVLNLIKEGEEDQKKAEDRYAEVLHNAAVAAQNLKDAEAALAQREAELVQATAHKEAMIKAAKEASAHEDEMLKERNEMKEALIIQQEFTAREIARIDFEKEILEEAINLQGQLHRVTQLLA